MFPLRCLSLVLLSILVVVIHCDDETLIEMKSDKLNVEETTEMEEGITEGEVGKVLMKLLEKKKKKNVAKT